MVLWYVRDEMRWAEGSVSRDVQRERERERERERYLRLNEERRWRKKGFDEDLGVLIWPGLE